MPSEPTRAERIIERLRDALAASHVELVDDSAKHRGHAGARSGAGHYQAVIVAECFASMGRVDRHRAAYAALGDLMGHEIHAFSAQCLTPEEWRARTTPRD